MTGGGGAGARATDPAAAREAAGSAALLLITAFIFGTNYVVVKWALLGAGPVTVTMFRAVFGAAAMLVIAPFLGASLRLPLRRADLGALVLPSALMAGSQLAFAFGVSDISAGLASLISNTMPVFSALLAWAVVREQPTLAAVLGMALAGGGVALAASVAEGRGSDSAVGVGLMALAVFAWAGANVSLKRWRPQVGEVSTAAWLLILGSFAFVPIAGAVEGFAVHWSWAFVGELLFSGGLGQVGMLCLLVVLARGSVMRASSVTFMVTIFAVAAGALLLDEPVRLQELLGGALIFAGVGLVVFRGVRTAAEAR